MKVLVHGVLLGVFLLTVEANHCRKVDWWHSFDKRGWSRCSHSTEYLNGIYRNDNKGHNDGLYLIEEGWCCKAPSPNQHQPSHCKIANWWSVLDRNHHWALCPKGYFLQGFYRTDGQWLGNIENGRCCRPNNLPDKYRHCYVKNVYRAFDHKGWNRCMKDYYLVGLYRGSCHYLGCIEQFKCCSMIVDVNKCNQKPCKNGATCVDLQGAGYRCNCKSGFTGKNCEQDINECEASPCKNGATCENLSGSYRCKCKSGYTGKNCEEDIDECLNEPCKNGGTCVNILGSYRCNCPSGFTGRECEKDIDECVDEPCKNGATCLNLPGSYRCDCKSGYHGKNCEKDINECLDQPCKNEATCVNLPGSYRCKCTSGFIGRNCETDKDECLGNPCKNGATCMNIPGSYRCKCTSAYTGRNCEKDINECLNKPCKNGGKCVNLPGSYRCNCKVGFTGRHCEKDINECLEKPCKNGATCVNHPGTYSCNCKGGFMGRHCQIDIDECFEECNPCKNRAKCVNLQGSYRCDCKPGYSGINCEIDFEGVGCYKDTAERAISSLEGKDPSLDGNYKTRKNPIAKCAMVARKRGYRVFAVQDGGWCAASATAEETFNKYGKSSACKLDGQGGPGANEVYVFQGQSGAHQSGAHKPGASNFHVLVSRCFVQPVYF